MIRLFALAERSFRSRRWPWLVALIAFALVAPTIGTGWLLDDNLHTFILEGNHYPGGPRGVWDLYHFSDGGAGTRAAMDGGFYPWWSNPELRLAFFRPITSLWRAADHAAFGRLAWPSHVEGCLLYAAIALGAGRMYRRLIGGAAAGLAAFLYAVDDAHALAVLWVANRHALVSTALGLLALSLHVGRKRPDAPSWAAAGMLLLALLGGESALGVVGYVVAYELVGRSAAWQAKARALAPHLAVVASWAVIYKVGGYGAGGNAFYIDPLRQPGAFAVAVFERAPKLIAGQLFGPPSELWPMLTSGARLAPFGIAALTTLLVGGPLWWATRGSVAARWLGLGALLAVVPVTATLPDDRLLLLPGFGAMGVVAIALGRAASAWKSGTLGRGARLAIGAFAVLHLVLAPVLLPLRAMNVSTLFGAFTNRASKTMPDRERVDGRELIVLVTVDPFLTSICYLQRYFVSEDTGPVPRLMRTLTVQQAGVATIERDGDRALVIRGTVGMLNDTFSTVYYQAPFRAGEERVVADLHVRILEVDDAGMPLAIRFEFAQPLEEKRFVVYEGAGFHEVAPPEAGHPLVLEVTPFMKALRP